MNTSPSTATVVANDQRGRQYRNAMADAAISFSNSWHTWSVMTSGCKTPELEGQEFDMFLGRFMRAIDDAERLRPER